MIDAQAPPFEETAWYVNVSSMNSQAEGRDAVFAIFQSATQAPTIEHETREKADLDLPWQVVVHNDPINLMTYVTMVFQRVFGFTREKAEKHMLEVHQQGRSIVWSGLRERAELYVQQLHGYLLLATIEQIN